MALTRRMRTQSAAIRARSGAGGAVVAALCIAGGLLAGVRSAARVPADSGPHDLTALVARITDLQATITVTAYDPAQLASISPDLTRNYALRHVTFAYKEPDKIRVVGHSKVFGRAMLIINGASQFYSVPKLRLHKSEDLSASPSRRQSLMEYTGLVSPETLRFMRGTYVREAAVNGRPAWVYDLTYQGVTSASSYRVWIDPERHVTLQRKWFNRDHQLKATFYYRDPHEIATGVWVPSEIEVRNADGQTGAVTALSVTTVDQRLPDSLFAIPQ